MEIKITERHLDITDDMKKITTYKVRKLRKFFPRIQEIHVVLDQEKFRYKVEIRVLADHFDFEAQGQNDDLQACVDDVVDKAEVQLRRHKEKLHDKKHVRKQVE